MDMPIQIPAIVSKKEDAYHPLPQLGERDAKVVLAGSAGGL
jgi:hypothetical protein